MNNRIHKIKKCEIEIIARAVVKHRGKILLCQEKGAKHYFLPGGHVEFGEKAESALKRELMEEALAKVKKIELITVFENIFQQKLRQRHEINFVYHVWLKNYGVKCVEDHIEYSWQNLKNIKAIKILPTRVTKFI